MGLTQTLILLGLGFIAFFATGIDDTVAYAGSYLNNKKETCKELISLGIIIGTFIALAISIYAGSLMESIPSKHLIGGAVLVTLGIVSITYHNGLVHRHKKHISNTKREITRTRKEGYTKLKFVMLGLVLFFATGIDDILAYSNLIMAKGSWIEISGGVLIATFVSLGLAHVLADKLQKLPHPKKIGGIMMIIIGILLALKIL